MIKANKGTYTLYLQFLSGKSLRIVNFKTFTDALNSMRHYPNNIGFKIAKI